MQALIGILMGSMSDWEVMSNASRTLDELGVPHEIKILSAHRTPDEVFEFVSTAEERGIEVLIGAAGGAAHLPGVMAAKTELPVLGVPMTSALDGMDSLLSIAQMPAGMPVGTLAIGRAGAVNAALFATMILSKARPEFREPLREFRARQKEKVLAQGDPRDSS